MMEFDSFGAFAAHLRQVQGKLPAAETAGLKAGAEIIQTEAKAILGTYQVTDTGPFEPWESLATDTMYIRSGQGYTPNDPLDRSGVLEEHIESMAQGREAATGVPDLVVDYDYQKPTNVGDVAIWMEEGTPHIPPRSFLGVAGFRKGEAAADEVARHVAAALAGQPTPTGKKRPGEN